MHPLLLGVMWEGSERLTLCKCLSIKGGDVAKLLNGFVAIGFEALRVDITISCFQNDTRGGVPMPQCPVEAKGQLGEVSSLLPPCDSGIEVLSSGLVASSIFC